MKPVLAIFKVTNLRFVRDKTALFFTILFPLIFLLIFGPLFGSEDSAPSFNVAVFDEAQNDFSERFLEMGQEDDLLVIKEVEDRAEAEDLISRAELDAILTLPPTFGVADQGPPSGELIISYSEGEAQAGQTFSSVMRAILGSINQEIDPYQPPFIVTEEPINVNSLKPFDYVFSGMLGFSILSLGIFSMAQGFASDKKTGSIARLQAAPIRAWQVVVGTAMNRIIAAFVSVAILFLAAVLFFDFSMQGDWISFIVVIVLGIISMFGIGLVIAGWAKNENQAAPVANLIATPMMFLSGSFFPRFLMPEWLQNATNYLPLTPINDSLRLILTENKTLLDLGPQILAIVVWTVITFILAAKVFKWE